MSVDGECPPGRCVVPMVVMGSTTRSEVVVPLAGAGLLDIDGLARRLGTSPRFVRRLVEERRIPYLKIGRLVRFDAAEVERWISSSRVEPWARGLRVPSSGRR
jgi:excisionase family DNA binding protein